MSREIFDLKAIKLPNDDLLEPYLFQHAINLYSSFVGQNRNQMIVLNRQWLQFRSKVTYYGGHFLGEMTVKFEKCAKRKIHLKTICILQLEI